MDFRSLWRASEELEDCDVKPGEDAGDAIRQLSPLLVNSGDAFREARVSFSDQTMLFADVADTIYADHFCEWRQGTLS